MFKLQVSSASVVRKSSIPKSKAAQLWPTKQVINVYKRKANNGRDYRYTLFSYKNNFIRTTPRLEFAQKLRTS